MNFDIYKKKDAGQCLPRDAAQPQAITALRQLGDERGATDMAVSCAAQLWCPGGWGVYSVFPTHGGFIAMWPHSTEVKSIYALDALDKQLSMMILRWAQFRCDPKHPRFLTEGKTWVRLLEPHFPHLQKVSLRLLATPAGLTVDQEASLGNFLFLKDI